MIKADDFETLVKEENYLLSESIEEGHTIVHCIFTSAPVYNNGGWVTIWPTTYLVHSETKERLQMLFAYNIPVAPVKHYFQQAGQKLRFTLIFPKLPENWSCFHLHEVTDRNTGFIIRNIPKQNSGIHVVTIN